MYERLAQGLRIPDFAGGRRDVTEQKQRITAVGQQNRIRGVQADQAERDAQGDEAFRSLPRDKSGQPDPQSYQKYKQAFPDNARKRRVADLEEGAANIRMANAQLQIMSGVDSPAEGAALADMMEGMGIDPPEHLRNMTPVQVEAMKKDMDGLATANMRLAEAVDYAAQNPDDELAQLQVDRQQGKVDVLQKDQAFKEKEQTLKIRVLEKQLANVGKGENQTEREASQAKINAYATHLEGGGTLSAEQLRDAAMQISAVYDAKHTKTTRADGSVDHSYVTEAIPPQFDELISQAFPGGRNQEIKTQTDAPPIETTKQRETRQTKRAALIPIRPVAQNLIDILTDYPELAAGRGLATKWAGVIKEQVAEGSDPSDPRVQQAIVRSIIESYTTDLKSKSRSMVDVGNFSKTEWQIVADLFGDPTGLLTSSSSAIAKLKIFDEAVAKEIDRQSKPAAELQPYDIPSDQAKQLLRENPSYIDKFEDKYGYRPFWIDWLDENGNVVITK